MSVNTSPDQDAAQAPLSLENAEPLRSQAGRVIFELSNNLSNLALKRQKPDVTGSGVALSVHDGSTVSYLSIRPRLELTQTGKELNREPYQPWMSTIRLTEHAPGMTVNYDELDRGSKQSSSLRVVFGENGDVVSVAKGGTIDTDKAWGDQDPLEWAASGIADKFLARSRKPKIAKGVKIAAS